RARLHRLLGVSQPRAQGHARRRPHGRGPGHAEKPDRGARGRREKHPGREGIDTRRTRRVRGHPEEGLRIMAEKKKADAKAKPKGEVRKKKKDPIADADTADVGNTAKECAKSAIDVVNTSNEKVSNIVLHPDVFRTRVNKHLLYEAVKQYRAGARAGTHATKNRALVSGSGKKPWRQKGTGRARVGETRTPLWRHGGTVFGPVPRDYSYNTPQKAPAAAMRSALTQRMQEGALKVVDGFAIAAPKTKELKGILDKLGAT